MSGQLSFLLKPNLLVVLIASLNFRTKKRFNFFLFNQVFNVSRRDWFWCNLQMQYASSMHPDRKCVLLQKDATLERLLQIPFRTLTLHGCFGRYLVPVPCSTSAAAEIIMLRNNKKSLFYSKKRLYQTFIGILFNNNLRPQGIVLLKE